MTGVRQEYIYITIEFLNTHKGYSLKEMCVALNLNRSSYYKWEKRNPSKSELLNVQITEYVRTFTKKATEFSDTDRCVLTLTEKR